MGLDTSHNCWHGGYGSFMQWRIELAKAACLPPLMLMEGFFKEGDIYDPFKDYKERLSGFGCEVLAHQYYENLPIRWGILRPDPICKLLYHSDCSGVIPWRQCKRLANRLEELLPELSDKKGMMRHYVLISWRMVTEQFIDGLRKAYIAKESVRFR